MAQKQAAIKVGQAYIPVEVDFAGLGARMKKEINDELRKVGREFELPGDGVKIPVKVDVQGGGKGKGRGKGTVIDQIIPEEKEVKGRLAKMGAAIKSFTSKAKALSDTTKYVADGLSANEFHFDATGIDRAIGKTRRLLNVTEKYADKIRQAASKPQKPAAFSAGFGGAAPQVQRKLLPIVSADVAKAAAKAMEDQLEGGLLSATGRIVDDIGQKMEHSVGGSLKRAVKSAATEAKQEVQKLSGASVQAEAKAEQAKAAAAKKRIQERIRKAREADKAAADVISGKVKPPAGQNLKGGGFIPRVNVDKQLRGYKAIYDEIQRINSFSKTTPGMDSDSFRESTLKNSAVAKQFSREYEGLMRVVSGKGPWTKAAAEAKEYLHTVERINRNTNLSGKSLTQLAVQSRKAWQVAVTPLEKLKALQPKLAKMPLGLPRGVTKQSAEIPFRQDMVKRQRAYITPKTKAGAIPLGGEINKNIKPVTQAWGKTKVPVKEMSEAQKFFKRLGPNLAGLARSGAIKGISTYGKLTDGKHALRVRSAGEKGKAVGVDGMPELQKIETKLVKFASRSKKLLGGVGKALVLGFKGTKAAIGAAIDVSVFVAKATAKMAVAGARMGAALASGIRRAVSTVGGSVASMAGSITSSVTSKLGGGLKAGFSAVGKAGGSAIKWGLSQVKTGAESFIKGGIDSFKHLGRRAGQAMSLGMGVAATYAAKTGVSTAAHFETAEVGMTTMLGSAEKAKGMLDELAKFSARTPFELRGIVDSSKQLLAYGFKAEQIMPILKDVGDASGALGLGNEGVDRITRALGQFKVKGRVMAEEMLQLTETGIPAYEMLAEHYGKTIAEVTDMVHKGEVDAETGIEALRKGMHKRYNGLMDKQAETLSGMMSNIKDQFALTTKDLFLPLVPQTKQVMGQVLETLSKTAEFAKTDWPAIWQKISTDPMGYLKEIFPTIQAKFHAYDWKGLGNKISSSFKYVWTGLSDIGKMIDWKGIGKTVLDALVAGLAGAYNMAKKLGNMFLDWFVSVNWSEVGQAAFEGIGKALAFMNDERGDLFANIGTRISDALAGTDWVAEGFKLGESLRNGLMAIWDSTVELGERFKNWIGTVDWAQVWSDVSGFTSAFLSGLFGGGGDIGTDIAAWFNSIDWAGIQSQATGWYEGFVSMITGAWESTKTAFGDWTNKLVEWFAGIDWGAVGNAVRDGLVTVWEWLLDLIGNVAAWLWPAIDKIIQFLVDPATWSAVVGFLEWGLNTLFDLVMSTWDKIIEWFRAIDWGQAAKWLQQTTFKLLESIGTVLVKGAIAAGKLILRVLSGFFGLVGRIGMALLEGVWEYLTGFFEGMVETIVENFKAGAKNIAKMFFDLFPGSKELAEKIGGAIGLNVNAEPPKEVKTPKQPPKTKGVSFEQYAGEFEAGYGGITVNQNFSGSWIEPEQAKRAAKLGARAGV